MSPAFDEKEEIPDRPLLRRAAAAAGPLGVLAFWSGLLLAARWYPSGYDWRYLSISKLFNPETDPAGYLWAAAGAVICSLCGLSWLAALTGRGDRKGGEERPAGTRALQFGYLFMICAALMPRWLLRIKKGHEVLAALAFAGLLAGMVLMMFQTAERAFLKRMHGPGRRARLCAFLAAGMAVSPILLAGLAHAWFYYAPPALHGKSFSWTVHGWPVLLRFPFWEWATCLMLSACMVILSLATLLVPRRRPGPCR